MKPIELLTFPKALYQFPDQLVHAWDELIAHMQSLVLVLAALAAKIWVVEVVDRL